MKLITKRDLIRNVAAKWRRQYEPFQDDDRPLFSWRTGITSPPLNKRQTAEKLDALDKETATPEDVANIIGNKGWTSMKCDECGAEVDAVVRVGAEPDYDSNTACLCFRCVLRAFQVVEHHTRESLTVPRPPSEPA